MLRLVFVSLFLLGAVIGWLVVYFVRKYKDHNPKGLRETIVLFLGGGCLDLLLSLIDKQVAIYAFTAYIIGFATAFFLHWIYQLIVAKITAQTFEELTSHPMGDMFLSPALTAYIRAKNVFDVIEGDF